MGGHTNTQPSTMKSTIRALAYFLFLTLTFPLVFLIFALPSFLISVIVRTIQPHPKNYKQNEKRKTVLVTGAPHTKGLQMCRFLSRAGHRVILADMKKFRWSAARLSNYVDRWIPTSHTCTAVVDSAVRKELEISQPRVKVLSIDSVETTEMLDDKLLFLQRARDTGLTVPEFYKISCCQDVVDLFKQGIFNKRRFFLKPLNPYSEDRVCFTRIPETESDLMSFLKLYEHKISKESPYFVSEFIEGKEYTGNVIARDGKIFMYISNPSSPVQIDYDDASDKKEIFTWVKTFVSQNKLSGSLCFDFLEDELTGRMMAIECNPRLHSSIVLMDTESEAAANAIYKAMEDNNNDEFEENIAVPDPEQKHIFWFHNEIGKLLGGSSLTEVIYTLYHGRDAVWDISDTLPFFLLPHLQIPTLLWDKIASGGEWEIVNFCLGQLR